MANIIKSIECPQETHPAGKVIFEEGAQSNCFYVIRAGQIDVYKHYGKPTQFKLASIPAGRVLGEISCLDDMPRTATAIAQSEVTLVRIPASSLKWQLTQCPDWFRSVILDLVQRLRATDNLIPTSEQGSHIREITSMADVKE